jgi:hypothetical protein
MSDVSDSIDGASLSRALAHPLRERLLFEYQRETTSPSRLAARLGEPLNVVSYHTNVLVELGCLALERTAPRRGATEHFYRAPTMLGVDDDAWRRLTVGTRRSLVQTTVASAADEARRAAWAGGFDGARAHLSRMRVELDAEGESDAARVLRDTLDDMARIDAESRARKTPTASYELVIMHFEAGSTP